MDHSSADIAVVNGIAAVPTILDVVCRTTGMGFAVIARVTEDRWVACSVLDQIQFGMVPGGELPIETTFCQKVRQALEPVVIDHVREDKLYCDHHTPRMYGFQSYISMPIILADGTFFGTLCAIDPKPAALSKPGVVSMFRLFAELISFHIDAAEKLARTETHLMEEREAAVLREQFIGVLGHDLRSPLAAISMSATLLAEIPGDEDQVTAVEVIEKSVVRMAGLIEDTMDFTRGRLGGGISLEAMTDAPLEPLLREVIREVQTSWAGRDIGVELDLGGRIHYDRRRLAQLFTNLLANAMTHGRADSPVTVRARCQDGHFELSVANAADPIPPSVLKRLFEPFSRGESADYREGLGLGLYIASQIARSHGGTLSVDSGPGETRFTFSMGAEGSTPMPEEEMPGTSQRSLSLWPPPPLPLSAGQESADWKRAMQKQNQ